ncbi:hypothetical protein [Lacrimispora celerecrescens]|nr:hypothetical protein [Lacrimispora celerecrescens]
MALNAMHEFCAFGKAIVPLFGAKFREAQDFENIKAIEALDLLIMTVV